MAEVEFNRRFAYFKGDIFLAEHDADAMEQAMEPTLTREGLSWQEAFEGSDLVSGYWVEENEEVVAALKQMTGGDENPNAAAARERFEASVAPRKVRWLDAR